MQVIKKLKNTGKLRETLQELNKKDKIIKFDFEISPKRISFLDTKIYKDENNNIQTILYCKPTDQQAYLAGQSEHP